ncbi:MAG: glycosyltransferase family 1 protein [Gemmatimonadales bacterium]|nr:glycosyltransferase family 1 protein [Gemmatimonadales bacterium]
MGAGRAARVQFFLPRHHWPADPLPTDPDDPRLFPGGILTHTLQTYLRLKAIGYPCELVERLPRRGLVVSHRSLIARARFSPDLFLVNMLADRGPHLWAQAVVVQNPIQAARPGHYLIPQWPQPGMIPRSADRGDRFERVAYFGREENLAPVLRSAEWVEALRSMGLDWRIVNHPRNDYHDVDAVVAARDFGASGVYDFKPAAKLVNAWVAGVIPLVAPEPAHLALQTSETDFLTIRSMDEAIAALARLKESAELRRVIMARGAERRKAFTAERITSEWRAYLDDVAWPAYREWLDRSRTSRWLYFAGCCRRWFSQRSERRRIMKDWFR